MSIILPQDVPQEQQEAFVKNMTALCHNTQRLFLFAADHKIEHLDADFHGEHVHPDAGNPEHLFKIAHAAPVGAFATQLGLIARYGGRYENINYIVKLNSKTNISDTEPLSTQLWTVHDVARLRSETNLSIRGIGYTVYLGSKHEHRMLEQAAQAIWQAHQHGLIAILWIYPRGAAVEDERSISLLAGAAGVANALGADFVKIKMPHNITQTDTLEHMHVIREAAGNTKVIFSGGSRMEPKQFQELVTRLLDAHLCAGFAVGRNIFQYAYSQAINVAQELAQCIYE